MLETEEDQLIIDLYAALDGEPADDADGAQVANDLVEKYGAETIEAVKKNRLSVDRRGLSGLRSIEIKSHALEQATPHN